VIAGNDACRGGLTTGCIVGVPLCHATTVNGVPTNTDLVLYCERFAAFQIVDAHSSSRIDGILLDNVYATGGAGGGKPFAGEVRIVKLSE
jgi:hypothetical protein